MYLLNIKMLINYGLGKNSMRMTTNSLSTGFSYRNIGIFTGSIVEGRTYNGPLLMYTSSQERIQDLFRSWHNLR